jgi:NTE family protein
MNCTRRSTIRPGLAAGAALAALTTLAGGCAHWPGTPALQQASEAGYRINNSAAAGRSDDMLVVLAISGGGMRAAALGFGVLEELRRTTITIDGRQRRLLDEVDIISAVSGGTLPSTYYVLRGERAFDEFPQRVLARNLEKELALRIFSPGNWFRLPSATFGKSDLFAELYDETVFDHARFADLQQAGGPFLIINGTDVTTGARFTFTQDQFDALCGDLSQISLGRAIATSTALPPLLTPITFENRGGTCGRKPAPWELAAIAAGAGAESPGRALLRVRALQSYANPDRPYVHVFDGGLSENLGLAELLRAMELRKVMPDGSVLPAFDKAHRLVVIAVNALRYPPVDWDRSAAPPDTGSLQDQMWSIPVDRISLDAVEQVRDRLADWQRGAAADGKPRQAYFVQVTFDALKNPAERRYFEGVKTSLALPPEQVDKLREVGGRLLLEAPAFRRLLAETAPR